MVNTTGEWGFYSIVQIILIAFSTDFLFVKIFALGRGVSSFLSSCESETATETLDFDFHWKYRVYYPPLLTVMRVPFEATCAPSVASRVYCILCIPYVITKFIYSWPYQTRSRNFRSLALNLAACRIHKRYCNLRANVTIGQTFRGSQNSIWSIFSG